MSRSVQKTLTFVTGNKGKLAEVLAIMCTDLPCTLTNMSLDLPELQGEPEEVALAKYEEFVKNLNSRPDCTIEETPKGWFIVYNPVDTEEALRRQLNSKRSRESADERQLEKVERHSFIHCHNSILGQVIKLQSAYTHDTTQMRDVKAPSEISGGNELKGFVLKVIVFVNLCSIILKDIHADEKYN